MNQHRRRKKRHTHGTKTVDVSRGKTGYGFTISGQQPCILSCIVAGSPADRAGLKTGDYLLSVNTLNVSKASHDEVVRLIGSSSGTLTLVIAENDNDSDSSDDDFRSTRPKSKYPNRVRLRHQTKGVASRDGGFGKERSENNRSTGHKSKQVQQIRSTRGLSPVVESYGRGSGDEHVTGSGQSRRHVAEQALPTTWFQPNSHHSQFQPPSIPRGIENMDPLSVAVYPRRQKHASAGSAPLRPPAGTKHTIITREMRMVKSQGQLDSLVDGVNNGHHNNNLIPPAPTAVNMGMMTTQDLTNILYPSIQPLPPHQQHQPQHQPQHHQPQHHQPQHPPVEMVQQREVRVRVVVGYVGSVEMPRDAHMPCSRQQSIRSAVRRLRVDHRVHTLVLMDMDISGIRMTNTLGSIVALYAAERIAFSGTCPDDTRFFGIVTLHRDDSGHSAPLPPEQILLAGSSCHVFMVDPDMAVHSLHLNKAKSFGIQCTFDPSTQLCREFPQLASVAVNQISKICRRRKETSNNKDDETVNGLHEDHRTPQQAPQQAPQQGARSSESSNSDSGLGLGHDQGPAQAVAAAAVAAAQVYVVDMPNNTTQCVEDANATCSTQDSSLNWTAERSAFHPADGSMYKSTGESDLSTMIPAPLCYQSGVSDRSMSSNANTSLSSSETSFLSASVTTSNTSGGAAMFDRLNLRVMPDPRGLNLRPPVAPNQDVLDKQNSADNLRRSMHKYMQSQAQQQRLTEGQGSSDADSLRSNESTTASNSSVVQVTKSTHSQGVTTEPPHKVTPRVFQSATIDNDDNETAHLMLSSGRMHHEFSVPAVPVLTKPPVPGRLPAPPPKSGFQTPSSSAKRQPQPERPKSTPPFRSNNTTRLPLAADEEYDSDPGSVMGGGACEDEPWDGRIADLDPEDEDDDKPEVESKKRKDKRRFSEGFFIKKRDKENVENSRLAKGGSFKQIKIKRRPTLSTSAESLVVSDGVEPAEARQKLNGAPSATNILLATSGLHTSASGGERSGPAPHGQRSARWAIGFHRLLQDAAGLATFTEFLKKEFSQENIDFWAKCEKYKQCDDDEQRQAEARRLWDLHLSQHSSEAVNVDATTLTGVEQGLQMALPTLFDDAQAHIFQLMKQDSYPRFLKSELYKTCVVAEMEGRPLPYPAPGEDGPRPREDKKITKSKSTVSMDKKRRQSFFPFSWNKSKSEKRLVKPGSEPPSENTRWAGARKDETTVRVGVGSLDLVDLNVMSREIRVPSSHEDEKDENSNHGNKEVKLCRVILPDGSTTVLHIRPGTSVRSNLQHLCQRRTLILPALEVFMHATDKAVDLTKDASTLASKEIRVEQRILFQTDLPSRRPLIVRVRPSLSLRDALKPVLPRYNCKVDNMVAHLTGSDAPLDLDASVTKIDGQRLVIQTEEDFAEWGGFNSQRGKPPLRSKSTVSLDSGGDDDDLLKDIMDAKLDVAHYFDDQGVFDPEKRYDKHKNEDGRTSGIFGFIRRNSIGEKDVTKYKNKPGSQKGSSQPATITGAEGDRPRPRPRPPIKDREAENLFEQLNKLSNRLDDQRGDTRGLKDLELPDFLKLDKDSGVEDSGRPRERRNSDSSILDAETSRRLSESISVENISGTGGVSASPVSNRIPYMDQSFSQDGVVPTHAQADALFSTACQYPGSPDLGRACSGPAAGNTDSRPIPTSRDPKRRHANDTLRSAGRHARTPRSRTPDPKRTLLQEVNGYTEEDNDDLSVRPLEGGTVNMEINEYSPPAPARPPIMEKPSPRTRKPAPLPPPRKMLTTPKKFLPPPTPPVVTPRHSHQNSTSSELSHYSGGSSASLGSTPSPSTHDLVVGDQHVPQLASPQRTRPKPPPRPSRRGHGTSGSASSSSADEGGRQSQQAQQQKGSGDNMQVSYV